MSNHPVDYSYLKPHVSVYQYIATLDYLAARRWSKSLWFARGEQSEIIRRAKEYGDFQKSLPEYWKNY